MNIGLIKRLGEQHPEVLELLAEWQSLSKQHDGMAVALMRKEMSEFDRNHTRSDAALSDRLKLLDVLLEQIKVVCKANRKRIEALEHKIEAQNDSSDSSGILVGAGSEQVRDSDAGSAELDSSAPGAVGGNSRSGAAEVG